MTFLLTIRVNETRWTGLTADERATEAFDAAQHGPPGLGTAVRLIGRVPA